MRRDNSCGVGGARRFGRVGGLSPSTDPCHQIVPGIVTRRCPQRSPAGPVDDPFTSRYPRRYPDRYPCRSPSTHDLTPRRARTVVTQGDQPIVRWRDVSRCGRAAAGAGRRSLGVRRRRGGRDQHGFTAARVGFLVLWRVLVTVAGNALLQDRRYERSPPRDQRRFSDAATRSRRAPFLPSRTETPRMPHAPATRLRDVYM